METQAPHLVISRDETVLSILSRIERIAGSDCPILLIGETGVGKEVFAEHIHRVSHRRDRPLVKINLATLPSNLIESELFGHERGAFTGSDREKKGQFELANGGTVFLDDIDDFPLDLQPKLLRVLESGEIVRLGGEKPIPLDLRLITASKIDLSDLVAQERFRIDLFYRINTFPLTIPPLRQRTADIPLLVDHFLRHYRSSHVPTVSEAAMEALEGYPWPGNVRELRNVIQRIALFADGEVRLENLPAEVKREKPINLFIKACGHCLRDRRLTFEEVLSCIEAHLLRDALQEAGGNYSQAARTLGMSLSTFRDKCRKHEIEKLAQHVA